MRTDTIRYGLHCFYYLPLPLDTSKCEKVPLNADRCVNLVDLVQEPVIGLIKWLWPKGLKVCSYVEKSAEFKN